MSITFSLLVLTGNTSNLRFVYHLSVKLSNPITGLDRPWGFQEVEDPRFQDNRHMEVVRLSVLRTGRLYHPPRNIPGTHFCYRMNQPQGHSAANSNDTIGNRTRDLPACRAFSEPTASPRRPFAREVYWNSPPWPLYSALYFLLIYHCVASAKASDADRTYLRYCPVRVWTRLRFVEGASDRRWLWSETSTHFHW